MAQESRELKEHLATLRRQQRTLVTLFCQFNKAKLKLSVEDASAHYELYREQIFRVAAQIDQLCHDLDA